MPGPLTLSFVGPVIGIRFQLFSLPLAFSRPLTRFITAVSLIFHFGVSWQNPPATGAAKGGPFHLHLHVLRDVLAEQQEYKETTKEKIEENPPDIHQVLRRKKEKEEKRGQWLGFNR
nr:hypothetical protein [uncultured Desulfobulbus sp.]